MKSKSEIFNKAARRIINQGMAIRREVMHLSADAKAYANRFLLKTANMVGRVLRAQGTTPRENLCGYSKKNGELSRRKKRHNAIYTERNILYNGK